MIWIPELPPPTTEIDKSSPKVFDEFLILLTNLPFICLYLLPSLTIGWNNPTCSCLKFKLTLSAIYEYTYTLHYSPINDDLTCTFKVNITFLIDLTKLLHSCKLVWSPPSAFVILHSVSCRLYNSSINYVFQVSKTSN